MDHISNEASVDRFPIGPSGILGKTIAFRVLFCKSMSHFRHQIFVVLFDLFYRFRGGLASFISWLHPRNPQGILAMMTIVAFLLKRYTNVKSRAEMAYRRKFWRNLMRSALTYEEWAHAAKMLDKETTKMNESDLYDVELVRNKLQELHHRRQEGSLRDIMFCMRADLIRNLGNMCNPEVHKGRLHVPKLIKEYIDEVTTQLRMVCDSDSEELSLEEKLAFMHETRHAFGRTALLLSGGASLGASHVGVVRTLVEHKLMPRIIAGSSVGSIMCSVVATRTWPELQSFFEDSWLSLQFFDQMGGIFKVVKRVTTLGAVHEIRQLQMLLRHLTSNLTFQEAYDMTGRVLGITVCSPRKHEPPRCLNYLTSPHVVIWSAVTASCAFPGLFEAQELMAKDRSGEIVPYHPPFNLGPEEGSTPARRWRDGSLEIDLPMMQLKELFNVNHFIVSQANPHIAPLLRLKELVRTYGGNFAAKLAHLVEMEVKHRCNQILELGFPLGGLAKLFAQDWEGDVTVVMPATLAQYTKIIQNPSYGELQKAANQGRRCTWEKLSAIKANCGIELALDECVVILNHMRRLKKIAERAASASHGLPSTVKFSASKRIPSWNCIARENSTGSLEDLTDVSSSLHQNISSSNGANGKTWKTHRGIHDGSDSDSESVDLHSWTRSGGPLMRTTSANMFIDFLQNLDIDTDSNKGLVVSHASLNDFQHRSPRPQNLDIETDPNKGLVSHASPNDFQYRSPRLQNLDVDTDPNKGLVSHASSNDFQYRSPRLQNLDIDTDPNKGLVSHASPNDFQYRSPRLTTLDRNSDSTTDSEQREIGHRVVNVSSILVTEGDLLQAERIHNGIVFNVVKKEDLTPLSSSSHEFENDNIEVAECVQDDCPGKEIDATSSASEHGDDESTPATPLTETPDSNSMDHHSSEDSGMDQSIADS